MTGILILKRGTLDPRLIKSKKCEKTQVEDGHLQVKERDLEDPPLTDLRKDQPCLTLDL